MPGMWQSPLFQKAWISSAVAVRLLLFSLAGVAASHEPRLAGLDPLTRDSACAWITLILGLSTLFALTFLCKQTSPAISKRNRCQRQKYEQLMRVVMQDVQSTESREEGMPEASRIFALLWDDVYEVRTTYYGIEQEGPLVKFMEALLKRLLASELRETMAKTREAEEEEYRSGEKLREQLRFVKEDVVKRLGASFVARDQLREAERLLSDVAGKQRRNLHVLLQLMRPALLPLSVAIPWQMIAEALQSVYYQVGRWQQVGDAAVAGDERMILLCLLDLAVGHMLIWFLEVVEEGFCARAATSFAQKIRTSVMRRSLVQQDFQYFDRHSTGSLQERLNHDAEQMARHCIHVPQEILWKVACICFTLLQVAMVCPSDMLFLALLPLPLIVFLHHKMEKVNEARESAGRKIGEDAAAATAEVLKEIRTVRQFANERQEAFSFSQRELLRNEAREKNTVVSSMVGKVFGVIIVSGLLFTEFIGARHVRAGRLTPGTLFDITIKLNFWVVMRIRDLLTMAPRMREATEPLGRICELLQSVPTIEESGALTPVTLNSRAALIAVLDKCEMINDIMSSSERVCTVVREELSLDNGALAAQGSVVAAYDIDGEERPMPAAILAEADLAFPMKLLVSRKRMPLRFQGSIEFSDVFFRYPTDLRKEVLSGLSFKVQPKQKVALVGEAGCGKSSCMSLLQRLYDPTEGCIRIDGIPLPDYNVHFLRSRVVIVDQKPVLFATSVRENITYGLQRDVSDDQVIQVLRDASLWTGDNGIQSKPDQILTKLGSGGVALSGGQTQRVSIARAMIRNPDIILLDEATSSLDNKNEKVVQEALDKLARKGSALVIAHRLTTIQDADKIIVMHKGRLAEEGTHSELMLKEVVHGNGEVVQGIYRFLWELQFKREEELEPGMQESKELAVQALVPPCLARASGA